MKGPDFAKKLDQQEEYLALLECLLRLEHHQVVAYFVHSVSLGEVSVALPSMVIAGLAIEPCGHRILDTQRVSSAPLAHFQALYSGQEHPILATLARYSSRQGMLDCSVRWEY